MMKKVNKATPEYATSETLVWWDMDSCPLPNGYDPSRLGPRIDTELKNLGYNGPLTIIAVGNVDGIPYDFLKVLSSNGFVIKHSGSSNEEKRRLDKGSVIPFSCGLCYFFCPSFEDFTSHLQSAKHARKVEVDNCGRDTRFKLALKELEAAKLSEPYLDQLRSKQSSFNRLYKRCTALKTQSKAKMLKFQKVVSSPPNNSTSKTKKGKRMEVEKEFESSLPKNTKAKEQSEAIKLQYFYQRLVKLSDMRNIETRKII
ncbi:hypothetical protein Bca52824_088039 [Brassica carinata]|uniref:NYN domain-containing protein n=1 Tax=Brassica carinata TaxID=52824 RepID=A0A8X7PAR5_BRACI|nr:hypothetical protein Bca52824_088039 [Brassica carinata]